MPIDPSVALAILASLFVVQHIGQTHGAVRAAQVARLGEQGYKAFYSVVSAIVWIPLAWIWWTHRHEGAWLWHLPWPLHPGLPDLLSALGIAVILAGLVSPAPTSLLSPAAGAKALEVRGILAVTRHPISTGATLWAVGHVLGNGYLTDVLFFGSHAIVSSVGAFHQDARYRSRPGYARFAAATSMLPSLRRVGAVGSTTGAALVVGLGVAAVLRWAHRYF